MATFPQAYTKSLSFLSATECCLLFLHRAQALPLSPSLVVPAAASHPSPAQCCCLDFLKQNHCICFNKISPVVFAPACFLHAPLSRPLQLNPPPFVVPSYLDFQHIYQSNFQSSLLLYTFFCLQMQSLCRCVFSLPPPPAAHQSPCLVSPAEKL